MLFWDSLHNCTGSNLYETLLSVFAQRCFSPEVVEALRPNLMTVLPKYHKYINETPLTQKTVKYIHEEAAKTGVKKGKPDAEETLIFEAAFVVLLHFQPSVREKLIVDFDSFLVIYPEFKGNDDVNERELMRLLLFHNMMVVALHIIPAKFKKTHLLDLVCRVSEGNQKKYVCGGGQSANVDRRVLVYERTGGISKQKRAPRWNEIIASLSTAMLPGSTPKADASSAARKPSGGLESPGNAKMRKMNPVSFFNEELSLPEHGNVQVKTSEVRVRDNLMVRASSIMQEQPRFGAGARRASGGAGMDVQEDEFNSVVNATASHGSSRGSRGFVEVLQHFVISDMSGTLLSSLAGRSNSSSNVAALGSEEATAEEADMRELLDRFEPDDGAFSLDDPAAGAALMSPMPSDSVTATATLSASQPARSPNARLEMMQSSQQYNSDKDVLELLIESGVLHEDDNVIMAGAGGGDFGVSIPVSSVNSEAGPGDPLADVTIVEYNDTTISISKKTSALYVRQAPGGGPGGTGLSAPPPAPRMVSLDGVDTEVDEFGIPLTADALTVDAQFLSPVGTGERRQSPSAGSSSHSLIRHPTIQRLMGSAGSSAASSFYGGASFYSGPPPTSAGPGPALASVATAGSLIEQEEAASGRALTATHHLSVADVVAVAPAPERARGMLTYNSLTLQLSDRQQANLPPRRGGGSTSLSASCSNNSTIYSSQGHARPPLQPQDSLGSDFGALLDDISQDIFVGLEDADSGTDQSSLFAFGGE